MAKQINLELLKKEIAYKWKVQSCKFGKATCVAYVDSRDIQDLLDEVCGPENWRTRFELIDNKLFCYLGIKVDGEWVEKADCGTEADFEADKSKVSDSVKRSAVLWGCGRFLYRLDIVELKTANYKDKEYPCDENGKIIWGGDALTDYINNLKKSPPKEETSKYSKPTKEPTYTTGSYSAETIAVIKALRHGTLEGKAVLNHFLDKYADAKKTTVKKLSELDNDEKILDLVKFVKEQAPEGI